MPLWLAPWHILTISCLQLFVFTIFSVSAGSTLFGAVSTCVHCGRAIASLTWTSRTSRGNEGGWSVWPVLGLQLGDDTQLVLLISDLLEDGKINGPLPGFIFRVDVTTKRHGKSWNGIGPYWPHISWAKRCCPKKADLGSAGTYIHSLKSSPSDQALEHQWHDWRDYSCYCGSAQELNSNPSFQPVIPFSTLVLQKGGPHLQTPHPKIGSANATAHNQ